MCESSEMERWVPERLSGRAPNTSVAQLERLLPLLGIISPSVRTHLAIHRVPVTRVQREAGSWTEHG